MSTDMEKEWFMYKLSCEFAVITYDTDYDTVTKTLNIEPDRAFKKGERSISKYSGSIITKPYNLWAIQSEPVISKELNLSYHIKFFRERLGDKIEEIEKLKNKHHFDCVFAIDIETEDAGAGFDLNEKELTFIKKIASRYSCHVLCVENIDV